MEIQGVKIPENYEKALKSAVNILNFADNSERRLREKLARKGFESDAVDFCVILLCKSGLLDEKSAIERTIERLCNVNLYGKNKIVFYLYAKGYKRENIESVDWKSVDFYEICEKCHKKLKIRYNDTRKIYWALLRYGFTKEQISAAFTKSRSIDY